MLTYNLTNYGWNNGVLMIAVFALVCLILIGVLINFMTSGGKKKEHEE